MSLGYTQALYLLPFDHRRSFQTGLFGWKGPLTEAQTRQVAAAKQVVYAGFEAAVAGGLPKDRAAILLDEQFGSEILRDAVRRGYTVAVPAERSGQDEFELLVPPTPTQLDRVNGDRSQYDHRIRPAVMTQVVRELQDRGVEPDVWKVEGLYDREDCATIVESARRDGRRDVSCIVPGRGASGEQVADWLRTAATDPGFIGFAVGRTTFWHALVA